MIGAFKKLRVLTWLLHEATCDHMMKRRIKERAGNVLGSSFFKHNNKKHKKRKPKFALLALRTRLSDQTVQVIYDGVTYVNHFGVRSK